ncbi:C40 family peptidase [Clostridium sediminicola]|uniref:C40 family peptidase n=1 Tax=Clostridium sediminicola TaxID=3114879 RepID=UPI0031F1E21C
MHKKLTATVLTAIILVSSISSVTVFADKLNQTLDQQKNSLNSNQIKLSDAKKIVEELNSKIELLDCEIENTLFEIEDLNNQIIKIQDNIDLAIKEIGQAEADMETEKDLYNKRMVAMYISGNTGFLEVIVGSESLSDLYSKIQIVKSITELDDKIISTLLEKKLKVENSKQVLEQEKLNLATTMEIHETKKAKLENDKAAQQKLINEAKKQVTAFSNAIKEDKKQISKTESLIKEAKAKAAAEAAAKAAAEAAAREAAENEGKPTPPSRGDTVSSNAIIAYASNFLGVPYQWGATGPKTFDCSGYTQYVFAHFGIKIPRVSRDQARAGVYVARENLKPGDLVFFAKPGKPVHHVGMYVGNNSFMHAPQTGDVIKISSLSSRSDYYTGRRFN